MPRLITPEGFAIFPAMETTNPVTPAPTTWAAMYHINQNLNLLGVTQY